MRKDNLYIKMKRRIDHGLCLVALCLLLLPSCTEDERLQPGTPDESGTCQATLRLDVGAFNSQEGIVTRSYVGGTDDEKRVNNIWVFQYNVRTDSSMHAPVYFDGNNFDTNSIEVQLTQNENGEHSVVCIVANVGEGKDAETNESWALDEHGNIKDSFNTYTKFLEQTIPAEAAGPFISSNMGESGGKVIPMFGMSKEMAIVSKSYVSVPLVRMFARVEVKVDPSNLAELGMEIEDISFHNIPAYCRVSSLVNVDGYHNTEAAKYPDDIEWKNFPEESSGAEYKENEITLYLPENLQGTASGMEGNKETDTGKIPENALCVNLTMSYDNGNKTHTYKVYPGHDMKNDFNIMRNYIYNVNIKITTQPE